MNVVNLNTKLEQNQPAQLRKQFDRQRFAWNDRIMLDPSISHLQFRVAVLITSKYLNFTLGYAYPRQEDLAAGLGLKRRAIQKALDALVDAGYLGREVARGHGLNNRYWPIFETENVQEGDIRCARPYTSTDPQMCTVTTDDVHGEAIRCARPYAHNPTTNPFTKPKERESTRSPTGKKEQTGWPEGFKLTPSMIAYAGQKRFSQDKAEEMFEKFRNNSLAKGNVFADWNAAWRTWTDREPQFNNGRDNDQDRNKIDDRL